MCLQHFLYFLGIDFFTARIDAYGAASEQCDRSVALDETPIARDRISLTVYYSKCLGAFFGILVIAKWNMSAQSYEPRFSRARRDLLAIFPDHFCTRCKVKPRRPDLKSVA